MRYFIGILMCGAGLLLILKTEWFIQNFGTSAWAEQHLGINGGTRLMYKVIGLILIFFGFMAITNLLNDFLFATVAKIFVR